MLKSWSMLVVMSYLQPLEQTKTQHICVWFYNHGTSRVQTKITLRWPNHLWTFYFSSELNATIVAANSNYSGQVTRFTTDAFNISHVEWNPVQVSKNIIFQLQHNSVSCRMLEIVRGNRYSVSARTNSDTLRWGPTLAKVFEKVLAIGGDVLLTVSSYDFQTDRWVGNLPRLNRNNRSASACLLAGYVYLFCGNNGRHTNCLGSIEKIAAANLVPGGTASWTLIQVPLNILIPRSSAAVAPLNDFEFVIMGGYGQHGRVLCDVLVFDTRTNTCQQVMQTD